MEREWGDRKIEIELEICKCVRQTKAGLTCIHKKSKERSHTHTHTHIHIHTHTNSFATHISLVRNAYLNLMKQQNCKVFIRIVHFVDLRPSKWFLFLLPVFLPICREKRKVLRIRFCSRCPKSRPILAVDLTEELPCTEKKTFDVLHIV